jgi:hypothetical protein
VLYDYIIYIVYYYVLYDYIIYIVYYYVLYDYIIYIVYYYVLYDYIINLAQFWWLIDKNILKLSKICPSCLGRYERFHYFVQVHFKFSVNMHQSQRR